MTNPQPPTTPAPEVPEALLEQWRALWCDEWRHTPPAEAPDREHHIAQFAAAWGWAQREEDVRAAEQRGADQELEACCEWLVNLATFPEDGHRLAAQLRAARRPAPPTLREQALGLLKRPMTPDGKLTLIIEEVDLLWEALQEGADG